MSLRAMYKLKNLTFHTWRAEFPFSVCLCALLKSNFDKVRLCLGRLGKCVYALNVGLLRQKAPGLPITCFPTIRKLTWNHLVHYLGLLFPLCRLREPSSQRSFFISISIQFNFFTNRTQSSFQEEEPELSNINGSYSSFRIKNNVISIIPKSIQLRTSVSMCRAAYLPPLSLRRLPLPVSPIIVPQITIGR